MWALGLEGRDRPRWPRTVHRRRRLDCGGSESRSGVRPNTWSSCACSLRRGNASVNVVHGARPPTGPAIPAIGTCLSNSFNAPRLERLERHVHNGMDSTGTRRIADERTQLGGIRRGGWMWVAHAGKRSSRLADAPRIVMAELARDLSATIESSTISIMHEENMSRSMAVCGINRRRTYSDSRVVLEKVPCTFNRHIPLAPTCFSEVLRAVGTEESRRRLWLYYSLKLSIEGEILRIEGALY